jgi:hypothetical protein
LHFTSTQCTKCGGFSSSLHIVLARVDFPDPAVPAKQSPFINSATHLNHFYEKKNTKKFLIQYSVQVTGNTPITINKRASELENNKSTTFIIIQNCHKLL